MQKLEVKTTLTDSVIVPVRFSEADSLSIVWHGHYIKYFEDGRESFGTKYGIGYLDVYQQGIVTSIVKIECDYKRMLKYGDKVLIETTYWDTEAAKLIFTFDIKNAVTKELVATGKSIQVFLNTERELLLNVPEFIVNWKKQHLPQHA